MKEIKPDKNALLSDDELCMKIFERSIQILGGPKKIVSYKRLTWVASLLEAALILVLKELKHKTIDEIAKELGIATTTVRNVLNSDPEKALKYINGESEEEPLHIAGGIAKKAFEELKKESLI
ncbi:MAG: transcriptional regulator [Thermotogaceae bacterium]|jgi:probable regulatory domain-containing protein|nr:transcriptional regulator [Thermotogaceae bacterium]MDN5337635.1 transcriptional regulator [Thermotogaceae bacterium]